jgi:hypothetical protein
MDNVALALQVVRDLRASAGLRQLDPTTQQGMHRDLDRLESVLGTDRYAQALDVLDLQNRLRQSAGSGNQQTQSGKQPPAPPPPPPAPPPPPQTAQIGQRAQDALEAVNFPGFVAALLTGTFQAIVDASAQQVREYAKLVASISTTLEDFTQENVSPNQARDHLAQLYPQDLMLILPRAGEQTQPRLAPRPERIGESPAWLEKYKLKGQELTPDLVEGPLIEAARQHVGEGRMQTLATMVLMGINRVVVNEGDVKAKLQFHAQARDLVKADIEQSAGGIASRGADADQTTQMMVSTLKANAQADASIKADLMGEVRISFRSETFPLERFADTAAIQLINRHARWRTEEPTAVSVSGGGGGPVSVTATPQGTTQPGAAPTGGKP